MRIAIVGSGISGLVAAYRLHSCHDITVFEASGVVLWSVGFMFEAVGDWQLARFRANPANSVKVLDRGLWRYTRHPN